MNDTYLPAVHWVEPGIRRGRCPRDGYARSWGLQFAGLRDRVRADPVYRESLPLAEGRSVMAEDSRINLYLILRFYLDRIPFGHVVEFGAYRCGNAMFMARVLERVRPGAKVYAFDTFAGMPATDAGIDAHQPGDFRDANLDEIRAAIAAHGIGNLELVPGLFEDTAAPALAGVGPVAVAHLDSDIRSALEVSYDAVIPHMVAGGYYVFDDATVSSCLGATELVEDLPIRRDGLSAEQIVPHFVFRAKLGEDAGAQPG